MTRPSLCGMLDAAAFLGACMTLAAPLGRLCWFLEFFTHMTPLLAFCFLGYAVFASLRHRRRVAAVCLFLCAVNAVPVMQICLPPPAANREVPSTPLLRPPLRVLQANVWSGNRDASRLLALIAHEKPDVILLQETDLSWMARLSCLTNDYPFFSAEPRGDNLGTAVFVSRKHRSPAGTAIPKTGIMHFSDKKQSPCAYARIPSTNGEIFFFGIHPLAPCNRAGWEERNTLLTEIAAFLRGKPRVAVTGDFNNTPYTASYARFAGESGLLDARRGSFPFSTWHTACPPFLRIPLDHCFHSPDLRIRSLRRAPNIGSDHFPLFMEIE